ncbi:MAG: GNAT family N-acetyltransferase [Pseudomonadota bacterium]
MKSDLNIRPAVMADAPEVSAFLEELRALGKRTLPSDQDFVRSTYIENAVNIHCSVAEDEAGEILGIQILKRATEGDIYGVAPGWGIIGTHVKPSASRRGVGKALFAATIDAARRAGLNKIDATIGEANAEGLAYYASLGFQTYRTPDGKICKVLDISD